MREEHPEKRLRPAGGRRHAKRPFMIFAGGQDQAQMDLLGDEAGQFQPSRNLIDAAAQDEQERLQ
jgi:hypothetical protein